MTPGFVKRLHILLLLLALAPIVRGEEPKIAAALQPYVDRHAVAGAVTLVADKDRVLSVDTVGYSDLAAKTLMGPDALFWIASQSKPITAAALMMLVDEGEVQLDDPIEKHLPEFRGLWLATEQDKDHILLKHPRRLVTVRDVLRHTSGMAFRSALETPTLDGLSLRDAVRSYAMTPLTYEPGTKYVYSNAGINTAGRIIEVVSGMPYEDFMQKRLFDPLGMKDTTFWPTPAQVKRLAKGYKPNAAKDDLEETTVAQLTYPLSDRRRGPMPAGGYFATADDCGRFCRMLLRGGELDGKRVLSENAVKEMTKRQTPQELPTSYGLGLSVGPTSFGHGGAWATNMSVDTKRGLVEIYLIQHAGFAKDGAQAQGAFRKAAEERFAAAK